MNTKVFYLVVGMLFFAGLAVAMFFALNTSTIKPGGQDIPQPDESTESYECQADAMICPDGSAVGRQGPKCEFAACPEVTATSTLVTAYLGGTVTGLGVSVSPQVVVSDSRCPAEVTCIWAGTVEVQVMLETPDIYGEYVMTLGKPQKFGDYSVTLIDVSPTKTEEAIPESSYRFTFEIEQN